ncbi:MAG: (d)CMP kinase [Candidatus Eremiobacterota bacterium]
MKIYERTVGKLKKINIAIDGPVASGKTSVARLLAKKMKYAYIDTGAMYRAITWKALICGIDPLNEEKISYMAKNTKIEIIPQENNSSGYAVFLDDTDVTGHLTEPLVRQNVSLVSSISSLRKILVELQQYMAKNKGIIMAGRDITTVVIPDSEVKIFLTASQEERARRRHAELLDKGESITFDEVLEEIKRRDFIDSTRKDSPLMKASDAIEVDCTDKSVNDVVEEIFSISMKVMERDA